MLKVKKEERKRPPQNRFSALPPFEITHSPLPLEYYLTDDVLTISQDLLGKFLITKINGELTGGMIVETEAYRGPEDRASHAYNNRRTKRNEVMYAHGGVCYTYLCYGIHTLFNIVTNKREIPHAILVRAIEPIWGVEVMLRRRKKAVANKTLTVGPGSLSEALGITLKHNATELTGHTIWLEDHGVTPTDIITSPRIGIDYAGEDALLHWRFQTETRLSR